MNAVTISLMQIQDVVQQFAEATSAALRLDVEVYDRVSRIAATGFLQTLVGRPILKQGVIWRKIYGDGSKKIIVDNPGKDVDCQLCYNYGNCKYKRAVYCLLYTSDAADE